MSYLAREKLITRLNEISQPDLSRINGYFTYLGCTKGDNPEIGNSSIYSLGEDFCWYDYEVWNDYGQFNQSGPELHRVLVTAIPSFVRSIENQNEVEALIDFMKEKAIENFPFVINKSSVMKRLMNEREETNNFFDFVDFYCLSDIGWNTSRKFEKLFISAQSEIKRKIGIHNLNQFGPIPYETLIGVYLGEHYKEITEEIRTFCDKIFNQYRRLVLSYESSGKLSIQQVGLNGIVDAYYSTVLGNAGSVLHIKKDKFMDRNMLGEFEELINSKSIRENEIQLFIENNPELLNVFSEEAKVYPQIMLELDDRSKFYPDFLIEPINLENIQIVDLKLPKERIILNTRNRQRFYAKVYEYIAQMREYGHYFESPTNRRWFRERYGIDLFNPELVLIIGKDYGNTDYSLLRRIKKSIHPIKLITYTELLKLHMKTSGL